MLFGPKLFFSFNKIIITLLLGILLYSCQHITREFVNSQNSTSNLNFSKDSLSVDYLGTAYFEKEETGELYKEGILASFNKNFPRAETKMKAALKLEPNNYSLLNGLGNIYANEERLNKSLEYYDKAIAVSDSIYPGVFLGISKIYAAQEEFQKALAALEYMTKIVNNEDYILQVMTYHQLTGVKLALLDCEGAERSFRIYENLTKNDDRFNALKSGVLKLLVNCTGKELREKYWDHKTGELLASAETLLMDLEDGKQMVTIITELPLKNSGNGMVITKENFRDFLYKDFYTNSEIAASGITGKRDNTLYAATDLASGNGRNKARITYKLEMRDEHSNLKILKVTYTHPEENAIVTKEISSH